MEERQERIDFVPDIPTSPDETEVLFNTAGFASFGASDSEVQSPQTPGVGEVLLVSKEAEALAVSKEVEEEEESSVMSAGEDSEMPSESARDADTSRHEEERGNLLAG